MYKLKLIKRTLSIKILFENIDRLKSIFTQGTHHNILMIHCAYDPLDLIVRTSPYIDTMRTILLAYSTTRSNSNRKNLKDNLIYLISPELLDNTVIRMPFAQMALIIDSIILTILIYVI